LFGYIRKYMEARIGGSSFNEVKRKQYPLQR
jgi:hypothetical protein